MEHTNTLHEQIAVFSFKPYSICTNQQALKSLNETRQAYEHWMHNTNVIPSHQFIVFQK